MFKSRLRALLLATVVVAAALALFVLPAAGQPPLNDSRSTPTVVNSLPFAETLDTSEATEGVNDPFISCPGYFGMPAATVWYSYTPQSDETVNVSTVGTDYEHLVAVFDQFSGQLICTDGQPIILNLNAGESYEILVGARNQGPYPYPGPGAGGTLQFSMATPAGPDNDDFNAATSFGIVPYSDNNDLAGATTEAGEPSPNCAYSGARNTIWYAFTPTTTASYSVELRDHQFEAFVAAYSGADIGSLNEISCRTSYFGGNLLTFAATAGVTYYLQVGHASPYSQPGPIRFTIDLAPPPHVDYFFYPSDPSRFDQVNFSPSAYDPAGVGIDSYTWDFGDGITSNDCCPQYSFGTDGDYDVSLTVTTPDGRSAAITKTVTVETHDVAITRFKTPQSARAGQTRQITVGIQNSLLAESVTVRLYRSTPNGFDFIGSLTLDVPVRNGNRTTDFQFSYTFTDADASQGSVTFKAEAWLNGARDALPGNNTAISTPANVNP